MQHDSDYGRHYLCKRNDGKLDTTALKYWIEEVAATCLNPQYHGGLVGSRGGFTYYITGYGYSGKYAIDLLEAAYRIFQQIKNIFINEEAIPSEIRKKIYEYLNYVSDKNTFSYSITNSMLLSDHLYTAWYHLQHNTTICKDLATDAKNTVAMEIVRTMLLDILLATLNTSNQIEL